jgi:DNA polymerase-3 subunit delta
METTGAAPRLLGMASLKPVYLVCGDDDPKIDAWRGRVRRRAEDENGPGALETFDGRADKPEVVAAALMTLTFATGDRYLLVDGVEAWKAGELEPLEAGLAGLPEGTVLVLVARGKPLARLGKAVQKAGGELREYAAPKPWELPKWAIERAAEEGLHLDSEAAKALVSVVGTRQQRIAREVERLATLAHPKVQLSADQVRRHAAGEATQQVYDLADALVAGDVTACLRMAERLTGGDERPGKLIYPIVRRLRDVHRAAELLDAGVPESKVAAAMKMPPWAAKRTLAQAKKADRDALARALCAFADLEIELRGGGAGLDEDTAFSLTLSRAAA